MLQTITPEPRLEHLAVWARDLPATQTFLAEALDWRRHPLEFGVDEDNEVFGGMDLAFVDANGLWLELVQPTTAGPGLEFLEAKGDGSIVELDFEVDDFDGSVEALRLRGIEPVGMDGLPLQAGGLLREWVIVDGRRERGDELLAYLPEEVSRGTSIELFTEFPTGVVLKRDADPWDATPSSAPRLDHVVVLAADLEATADLYTNVLNLTRLPFDGGVERDWLGVGETRHAWLAANDRGFWIELVAPDDPSRAGHVLNAPRLGDGAILELGAEVADLGAFHERMAQRGVTMTAGDGHPLPAGPKPAEAASGDRFSYFPLDYSKGMRIRLFERASSGGGVFDARDATA